METPIYIKIPGINGDATETNHKQWIQVTQLNFSAHRRLSSEPGHIANRESTRPSISELTIEKPMDSASSLLFGEACTGKSKTQVTIDCCKTGDKGFTPIAQFTLDNVIVSGYELISGEETNQTTQTTKDSKTQPQGNTLRERITLSFDKIEMKTIPYSSDGSQRTPISYKYDMEAAQAA